jgi:photosystem II stability/assembly factor-like uncharacterized protein
VKSLYLCIIIFLTIEFLPCKIIYPQWTYLGLGGKTVEVLREYNGFLYAGTNAGIFRKQVNSPDTNWNSIGLQSRHTLALLVIDDTTYLSSTLIIGAELSDTVSLYKSTNGGKNWFPYQNGFDGYAYDFESLQSQPGLIFATGLTVSKSINSGMSWQSLNSGFKFNFIVINKVKPNLVWTGGNSFLGFSILLKSTTFGETWQFLPTWGFTYLSAALNTTDSNIVYIGMSGGIIKTFDGGTNWIPILTKEDFKYFYGLSLCRDSVLYAGGLGTPNSKLQFYVSYNGGISWDTINSNSILTRGIKKIIVLESNQVDNIYFGTDGDGVFNYRNILTYVEKDLKKAISSLFSLQQNYPNPFNSETVIHFDIAMFSHVSISVFDVLGRKLHTIEDKCFIPGKYSTRFSSKGLSSGIYFYNIQAEGYTDTKKFIIIK